MATHLSTARKFLFALLAGALLCSCAPQSAEVKLSAQPAATPPSPRELYMAKCSHCHEASKGYAVIGQKEKWIKLVAAMAAKDLSWINTSQMKIIIAYHDEHVALANDLFNRKCGACHQWNRIRQMSKAPSQWKTMITFMSERCNEGLTKDEVEIIHRALVP